MKIQSPNIITQLDVSGSVDVTGAVTASFFVGDGSGLTGIAAQAEGFPYTGSAAISGSLEVDGPVTATIFNGDGSGLTNLGNQVFPFTGSAIISGSLEVIGPFLSTAFEGVISGSGQVDINSTAGILEVQKGGTGQLSYTNGQLLIGNTTGNTLAKATLTQGTGITITNGAGSITVTNASPNATHTGDVTGATALTIATNAVSNTKFRQSAGLSVVGRSASTTGDVADIAAGTDHQVLRRSGTALAFGAVALNQTAAVTGTLPVANGGTGATTFTAGKILFGNTTSALNTDTNFHWDNTNKRLGVGTASPSTALDVSGTLTATTIVETSSERFKENIQDLAKSVESIQNLRPVSFNRKESDKHEIGFIAEEIQQIYPEIVTYDETGQVLGVEYSRLTAPLVQAVQYLMQTVKEQAEEIQKLKEKL